MTHQEQATAAGPGPDRRSFPDALLREWLLVLAVVGLVVGMAVTGRRPAYTTADLQVLVILAALLVTARGLESSGFVRRLSWHAEQGGRLPLKLVLATFVLSMFLTNDVALVVVVPLTLALATPRRDLLVILEALAANAGSALTPIGNPQNLILYWSYGLAPGTFVAAIAPFSLVFLVLLTAAAAAAGRGAVPGRRSGRAPVVDRGRAVLHGLLLVLVVLVVLRVLPPPALVVVAVVALVRERDGLRIDYALLATLFCFFGIADILQDVLGARLEHAGHTFLASALASQVVGNVPAALLFTPATTHWRALLWGVNVGGFGGLVASLANLIAYRLYVARPQADDVPRFTLRFVLSGYAAFFLGSALYFLVLRAAG